MSETPMSADVQSKEKSLAELMARILAQPLEPLAKGMAALKGEMAPAHAQLHKELTTVKHVLVALAETLPQQSRLVQSAVGDALDDVLQALQEDTLPSLQRSIEQHVAQTAQTQQQQVADQVAELAGIATAAMAAHTATLQQVWTEDAVAQSARHQHAVELAQTHHRALQQAVVDAQQVVLADLTHWHGVQTTAHSEQAAQLQAWMAAQWVHHAAAHTSAHAALQHTLLAAVQDATAQQQSALQNTTQTLTDTVHEQVGQAVVQLQQSTHAVAQTLAQLTAASTLQSEALQAACDHAKQSAMQQHQLQAEQLIVLQRQQQRLQRGLLACGALLLATGAGVWWPAVQAWLGA